MASPSSLLIKIGWSEMSGFNPPDPAWETKIRDSFARQGYMTYLSARLARAEPGLVEIEVGFRPELTQQHGFFHAGVTASLADTAGGYAGFSLFPAGSSVLTVEFKLNLVAPAKGERLRALGQVVKPGRTLTICELKVFAIDGERATLCATGLQTLICLRERADG
jgi:uncharacterized protein (TIGR00369 family)